MRLVLSLRKRLIATAIFSCFAEQAGAQSLDEVVVTVVRSHPVVESVRAQSRAAEQRIAEEEGALLPRVDLSGAAGEEFTNNRLTRLRAKDHDTLGLPRYDNSLTIRQLLLDGGATDSRIESARASSEAAVHRLNDAGQRVALLAVEVYVEVLRARASLARAEANIAAHYDILAGIERRARTGVGRGTDVDQARSRVALAEATLAQRQGTLEEATARYLETVGTLPGGLRRPNDPQELAPPALAAVLARALAASPAIKAAGANVAARAADRTATEGAFWPRFTFEVAGRADHNIDGTRGPDSDLIAQLRMTYNIYAGGADTARERRAIEDVVAAKFDELEAQRRARETVRVAHSAFVSAKARLRQLKSRAEITRRLVGAYVPQEVRLFSGTIRDNIAVAAPHIDDAAVTRAGHAAALDDWIKQQRQGYARPVGESGQALSGGQRQGVAVARALLEDPRILIFDEPTANMDTAAEQAFVERLDQNLAGRTLLVATHRTALLPLVQRLIVISEGKIVLDGPRDQILRELSSGKHDAASLRRAG